jgi:hypothetical protein
MPRGTLAGHLAATGFADTGRAEALLAELGLAVTTDEGPDEPLLRSLSGAADPKTARVTPTDQRRLSASSRRTQLAR